MNTTATPAAVKALADKLPLGGTIAEIFAAIADALPGVTAVSERHGMSNIVGVYTGPRGQSFVDYLPSATREQHAHSALRVA